MTASSGSFACPGPAPPQTAHYDGPHPTCPECGADAPSGSDARERADGATSPWAEDIDGVWHHRPPDSGWEVDEIAGGFCQTTCGQRIWSCRTSQFDPRELDAKAPVCVECDRAVAALDGEEG